jgi:hypothetical protein
MPFHHPTPLEDWRLQCPCGARAENAYGICRKCRARLTWNRRKARTPRISRARRTFRRFAEAVSE